MKPNDFIHRLDEARIVNAVAEAERRTSGEIRIFVSHRAVADPLAAAAAQFKLLGMDRTQNRNAVLIFVVPTQRQFAVVGDSAVHQKCGDDFWRQVSVVMSEFMKQGKFTEAIAEAVGTIGGLLAQHYPRHPDDQNELPDRIVRG